MSLSTADYAAALADLPLIQWNEVMNQAVAIRTQKERERRDLEEAQADLPHKQASSTSELQILIFTV